MAKHNRKDGRRADELRAVRITPGFVSKADGSCLIEMGGTRVICTASFVPGVPEWRQGRGKGWLTAEYGMLPASTGGRKSRPGVKSDGRAVEIQRLIGRVLRSVVDFAALGENTLYLDCDVLEADGGTRTAAITGAQVALSLAVARAAAQGQCSARAVRGLVAAVSVGMLDGRALLDLDYSEDSAAEVDMNVAMTSAGRYVEVQGTAEGRPFAGAEMDRMLRLARGGIRHLVRAQREAITRGGRKKR
ncbi:MAG TPA: ribonuclease PH [Phycisphaerales bacterium]|nr:ribonuclease PH [Phycisphaerales bacterium]